MSGKPCKFSRGWSANPIVPTFKIKPIDICYMTDKEFTNVIYFNIHFRLLSNLLTIFIDIVVLFATFRKLFTIGLEKNCQNRLVVIQKLVIDQ